VRKSAIIVSDDDRLVLIGFGDGNDANGEILEI